MADPRKDEPIPFTLMRGYVLSEDAEFRLRTIAEAMRGIAALTEGERMHQVAPEMPAGQLAAIFLALGEATDNVRRSAGFTQETVRVREREPN